MNKIFISIYAILLFFTSSLYGQDKKENLNHIIETISAMGETIHSLQQERGASCGFISSKGTKFKDKLKAIKLKSNKNIDKLELLLNQYTIDQSENLRKTFQGIYLTRKNVSNLKIDFTKAYSKYTQSIAFMLLQISKISENIENKELANNLYLYSTLLMYKESIGQKRAALSSLFSQKEFNKEIYEYFLTSDTQEKIYLNIFLHTATKDIKKYYSNTKKEKVFKTVIKYENLARMKLSGKNVNVDPDKWFDTVTNKINLIQNLEHKILKQINMIVYKINTNSYITLTQEEKQWLEKNPIVKIAVMTYWKSNKNGENIHTDMLKLLNKYGKINLIAVKYNNWKQGFENAAAGDIIYGIMNLSWSKEREDKYFHYTQAYNYAPNYLITRKDAKISSLYNLENKTIYLKEKAITHDIIKKIDKNIKIIDLTTNEEMYEKLANNKNVSAFISYAVNKKQLKKYNLKIAKMLYDKTGEVSMGISKKYKILANIINKIYKNIPKHELDKLREKDYSDAQNSKPLLTKEEKEWIDKNIVTIGVSQWKPIIFSNTGEDIDGVAGDFVKEIIKQTGLKVKIINDKWPKILDDFKNSKIDFLPSTYYTKDRSKFGLYGDGYFKIKDAIYLKSDNTTIFSLKDLVGKKLAIKKGYGTIAKLQKDFPNIKLVFTKNLDDSINQVLNGKVDAFYEGQISAETKIKNELIKGLKAIAINEFNAPALHFFSNINKPILHSILDKGLKSISYKNKQAIINQWVSTQNKLNLTQEEQEWIDKKLPLSYVYDPDWAPFEWKNELGNHTGIIADILEIISQKSGIKFIPTQTKTWNEAVEKMENNSVDMYSAVVENEKRQKYVKFTSKNIYSSPGVLVIKDSDKTVYIDVENALKNKRVGVVNGNAMFDYLKHKYPTLAFEVVTTTKDGFEALQDNKIDVFILNAATAQYFIKNKGYEDTRIATKIDFSFDLKIAIQKNIPSVVLSILDKSINSISQKDLNDIYNKWTHIAIETKTDWGFILKLTAGVSLLLLFILWNNHKLKLIVAEKTKNLNEQNRLAQQLNRELEESEYELQLANESLEYKIEQRTAALNETKKQVEAIHKHTRESIEFGSLIQGALIPEKNILSLYFKDHFVTWTPKDTVGGDIWLFNELRHDDECLLFFIDCTGHGVPGAFVTMIVKAVEREIVSKILKHPEYDISPALVMGYFNKTIKKLLKQESKDSLSNAGWDGGIIYYNRRDQILKFAGAETPLFYTMPDGEFKTIKGNRYSVGYKKCDPDYQYKETIIEVEEGMKFYCTTDGYLDQNGGEKDFPFGKKRFSNIIKENYKENMAEQQNTFMMEMMEWEEMIPNNDRNDDMTLIGFEIGAKSSYIEDIIEEIVKYEGVMTQNVIASCMDNIEAKISNMGLLGTISTITIEYCQNMMNYSKDEQEGSREIVPAGTIEVKYINDSYYEIIASNIVAIEDKEKIEPKLIEIQSLDKAGIKKRYRELRKSGQNTHEKGGGIGMYEIAKVSNSIEYDFTNINDDKYKFVMKSIVETKKKKA